VQFWSSRWIDTRFSSRPSPHAPLAVIVFLDGIAKLTANGLQIIPKGPVGDAFALSSGLLVRKGEVDAFVDSGAHHFRGRVRKTIVAAGLPRWDSIVRCHAKGHSVGAKEQAQDARGRSSDIVCA
jgi:hypothetical protein